jgi:hypothetical protein
VMETDARGTRHLILLKFFSIWSSAERGERERGERELWSIGERDLWSIGERELWSIGEREGRENYESLALSMPQVSI